MPLDPMQANPTTHQSVWSRLKETANSEILKKIFAVVKGILAGLVIGIFLSSLLAFPCGGVLFLLGAKPPLIYIACSTIAAVGLSITVSTCVKGYLNKINSIPVS